MSGLSIKTNVAWNTAGSLLYSGCQWLVTVLVVRLSSSYDAAGTLALAMAVSNVFAPIALWRIRSYQVSDVHEETSSGQYVALRIVTLALAFGVTTVYAVATCAPAALPCVFLYLLFRSGDLFIDVLHGIDQQHMRMDYCGKSMVARSALFLTSFSAVLALTDCLELAVAAMAVTTFPVVVYDLRRAASLSSVRPDFDWHVIATLLRRCLPAVVGIAACNLVVTFARQYLGQVAGEQMLGVYASICTPIVLIQACANYVYAPLLGVFATHLDRGDRRAFAVLLAKVVGALAVVFALGAVVFALVGDWFLALVFGPSIVPYGYLMYAGILSSALTACVAFLSDLLITMRDMRGTLLGNLAACVVAVPATLLLVDSQGMNGASLAIAVSYAVGSLVMGARVALRLRGLPAPVAPRP